ncbi:prolyl oligopeptidase family serine peptidase [Halomonas profundus]|nr:prolyl oligopeptidase family serine peptidase [Halomonas profundus]
MTHGTHLDGQIILSASVCPGNYNHFKRAWTWRNSHEGLLPTTPIEIGRYPGPLLLSHGTKDRMWSVEMTKRLEQRLREHGRSPEVHYYEGEDHIPSSSGQNAHCQLLLDFFSKHLIKP